MRWGKLPDGYFLQGNKSIGIVVASVSCIYNIGSPENYRERLHPACRSATGPRATSCSSDLVNIHYERNETEFLRGKFRVKGGIVDVFPAYMETALRVELGDEAVASITEFDPLTGDTHQVARARVDLSGQALRHPAAPQLERALAAIEAELTGAAGSSSRRRASCWKPSAWSSARATTWRCSSEMGFCHGIENYSRHLSRPAGRRAALLPARLLPQGLPAHHRRVARRRPPDRRHVRGRPLAQADLGGLRLPPALGPGQPAAEVLRVRGADGPDRLRLRHARALRAQEDRRRGRRAGHPAHGPRRPGGRSSVPSEGQIDDLIGAHRRTRGRSKERALVTTLTKRTAEDLTDYLARAGPAGALPALRHRLHGAHRDPAGPARRATSTCWSASTCCGRAWTCRRSPSSRSWTPTTRASCARETTLIQISRPRRAQRERPGDPLRRHDHRLDEAGARRDGPPPREADRLQQGARHHAAAPS